GVVEKVDGVQAQNTHLPNIRHAVVGVERFFEAQRRRPCIGTNKLQFELGTESNAMREPELSRPPVPGAFVALRHHADDNRAILLENRFEPPGPCAHEPMCRSLGIIGFGAKPRETDRDSTSDCLTILHRDFELRKSTSALLLPAGFQEVTWAPCRYIWPSQRGEVICTRGIAPLPSPTLASPGIPNRRSISATAESVSILRFSFAFHGVPRIRGGASILRFTSTVPKRGQLHRPTL